MTNFIAIKFFGYKPNNTCSVNKTCIDSCLLLAISEILYGIITKNKGSITAGILTLLVCNECSQQPNNSNLLPGVPTVTGVQ